MVPGAVLGVVGDVPCVVLGIDPGVEVVGRFVSVAVDPVPVDPVEPVVPVLPELWATARPAAMARLAAAAMIVFLLI
jgi:hypothetical protein